MIINKIIIRHNKLKNKFLKQWGYIYACIYWNKVNWKFTVKN